MYAATLKSSHQLLHDLFDTVQQMGSQYQTMQQHLTTMKTKWYALEQERLNEQTKQTQDTAATHTGIEEKEETSQPFTVNQVLAEDIGTYYNTTFQAHEKKCDTSL